MHINIFNTRRIILAVIITILLVVAGYFLLRVNTEKTQITTDKVDGDNAKGKIIKGSTASKKKNHLSTNSSVTYESKIIESPKTNSNAVILHWDQKDSAGEVVTGFRLFDGVQWSKWVESSPAVDRKDGTSVPHAALVLGNTVHKIQYRFEVIADKGTKVSPEVDLTSASIELVDTTKGPSPTKSPTVLGSILQNLGFIKTATAHSDDPRIITRAEWGSPEPNGSANWTPEYRQLEHAIVHHTAVAASGDSAASVRAIWHFHTYSNGWGDIGYNYLVDMNGNIFQGRYYDKDYAEKHSVDVVGGHALSYNYGSTGIAALGDFTNSQPSGAMLNSISTMAAYKLYRYGVEPSGWRGGYPVIVGHRDVMQTSCPGNIHNHLPTIRSLASTEYNHFSSRPFTPLNYEVVKAMDSPAVYLAVNNELRPIDTAGKRDCFIMAYVGNMRSVSAANIASKTIGAAAPTCIPPNYTWYYPEADTQQYVLLYGGMYTASYNDVIALNGANKAHPLSDVGIQYLHDNYVDPEIPGHILIKGAGQPQVYEANNDNLQHVATIETRDCLISQIGSVNNVPDSLISTYQSEGKILGGSASCTISTGQIMHPDGAAVAQVSSGVRHYVSNPMIRDCIIGRTGTGNPYKVSLSTWNSFSSGSNAYCPYDSSVRFVRENSSPEVWRVFTDGRKQHANGFCVVDPWTTPLEKFHVHVVPSGETAGHTYDGVFNASPSNCAAIT